MSRRLSRQIQILCAVVAVLGFAPWTLTMINTTLGAIESKAPLTMSLAAWLVMLVPLWVIWFGLLAWRERNASVVPAVLMALPAVVLAGLGLFGPLAGLMR